MIKEGLSRRLGVRLISVGAFQYWFGEGGREKPQGSTSVCFEADKAQKKIPAGGFSSDWSHPGFGRLISYASGVTPLFSLVLWLPAFDSDVECGDSGEK